MTTERQPPTAFDATFLRRAQDRAIEIELADPDFARKGQRLGKQPHHITIAGFDDGRDATLAAELGV